MEIEKEAPDWGNEGVAPQKEFRDKGFEAGYKPPAGYFNWFWKIVSDCLQELQKIIKKLHDCAFTGDAETVNGFTVGTNVPHDAKFTDTLYLHPDNSGNKHIPTGGESGTVLKWSDKGTATWEKEEAFTGDAETVNGFTVGTNVPHDAKFTDTLYLHPNNADTRHVTDAKIEEWDGIEATAAQDAKEKTDAVLVLLNSHDSDEEKHVTAEKQANWDAKSGKFHDHSDEGEGRIRYSTLIGLPEKIAPSGHSDTHSTQGNDPITPQSIGAVSIVDATNLDHSFSRQDTNLIDLAIEIEKLKGLALSGVNTNMLVVSFLNLDKVTLKNGIYDQANKKIYLP